MAWPLLTPEFLYEASINYVELTKSPDFNPKDFAGNKYVKFLPDIAAGKLSPVLVVAWGLKPKILEIVCNLSPEDQAKLSSYKATLPVVNAADGKTVRERRVLGFLPADFDQVFDMEKRTIRDVRSQKRYLTQIKKRESVAAA